MAAADELTTQRRLSEAEVEQKNHLLAAGDEAFDGEDYARALDCYHRASLLDGSDPVVWTSLGLAYANLDLLREAWRSYKLALIADGEALDTLWYAAEFLYNVEDFIVARPLLERYISLEEDAQRREEAKEMLAEAVRLIGDDDEIRDRPVFTGSDDPFERADVDVDDLEGFGLDDEDEEPDADNDDDYADDDMAYDDEQFVAGLQLELTGMGGKCPQCQTSIPLDAPYCYSCRAPHIYKDN
jgi:tetratricopeptide (TPR) repeat protein